MRALERISHGYTPLERRVLWFLIGRYKNTNTTLDEIAERMSVPVDTVEQMKRDFNKEVRVLRVMIQQAMKLAGDAILLERAASELERAISDVAGGKSPASVLESPVDVLRTVVDSMQTAFIDIDTKREIAHSLAGADSDREVADDEPREEPSLLDLCDITDLETPRVWSEDDLPALVSAVDKCKWMARMMRHAFAIEETPAHV